MSSAKSNPIMAKAWHAAAVELAQQNRPVELVPHSGTDVELPRVRARLLSADAEGGALIVEKPDLPQAQALNKGVVVDVYLINQSTRMQARSRVIDLGWFKLNKQTKVMAVRLEPVTGVASAQRRACFRLPMSAMGITAQLRGLDQAAGEPAIKARVLDLSDRGLGVCVRLEIEAARQMKDRLFAVRVPLPGQGESLDLEARLVRVIEGAGEAAGRSEGLTFGLQFEFRNLKEQLRIEQMVQQFSVAQQRKQLQRMRGAG